MEIQKGDEKKQTFSFFNNIKIHPKQLNCYITYTNQYTHDIIRENLHLSSMFNKISMRKGPRYCPSIEDKVVRFSSKERHQVFLEPEGLDSLEIYPNGLSNSLPFEVQLKFVRSISGLEKSIITRPGYAIAYDFFSPIHLNPTLETKYIEDLFFAGQINGTTGYEEAAAQGLVAGINAALSSVDQPQWIPRRDQCYIGVLIDDLITKGVNEPYRMFTSRAEYRLLLREDNAHFRLSHKAIELGLLSSKDKEAFLKKNNLVEEYKKNFQSTNVPKGSNELMLLENYLDKSFISKPNIIDLFRYENIDVELINKIVFKGNLNYDAAKQVEISTKYEGYIKRQKKEISKMEKLEGCKLSSNIDYNLIPGLSNESRELLSKYKPYSLGTASRIPGITPACISLLCIYIKKTGIVKY